MFYTPSKLSLRRLFVAGASVVSLLAPTVVLAQDRRARGWHLCGRGFGPGHVGGPR